MKKAISRALVINEIRDHRKEMRRMREDCRIFCGEARGRAEVRKSAIKLHICTRYVI